ncbi:integrase core domain-containing protein [Burkholderia cepacia]|uniref:integrase core domain-containing protein n=1 Tax=Burkholderia cepacia TaxID=292 RepID=UPI0039BEBFF1
MWHPDVEDGKGSWRDNMFFERLWHSVKYEDGYLKAYGSASHARRSIGQYIELYDRKRLHSSRADQTPDEAYFAILPAIKSAARLPRTSQSKSQGIVLTSGVTSLADRLTRYGTKFQTNFTFKFSIGSRCGSGWNRICATKMAIE